MNGKRRPTRYRLLLFALAATTLFALAILVLLPVWNPCLDTERAGRLRAVSLALRNYHSAYGSLPPAYVVDRNGSPMHSWRVLLLPFLGQEKLYERYDFQEPWNGPHNRLLEKDIPGVYRDTGWGGGKTAGVFAVVGAHTAWPGAKPISDRDMANRLAFTVLLVSRRNSNVSWMEPRDLTVDDLLASVRDGDKIGNRNRIFCAFADDHIERLANDASNEHLRALVEIVDDRPKGTAP